MSALARSVEAAWLRIADALPDEQTAQRRQALQWFTQHGLPDRRNEDWRYTDLTPLNQRSFEPADAGAGSADMPDIAAPEGAETLRFRNGHRVGDESANGAVLDRSFGDGVSALNAILAEDGLQLEVPAGERREQPLYVVLDTSSDDGAAVGCHLRHRIRLGRQAEATVILHHRGRGAGLDTQVLDVDLEDGARLELVRLQEQGEGGTQLARSSVQVGRDASLEYIGVELGMGLTRHDLNIALGGAGAQAEVSGIALPIGKAHVDVHLRLEHRVPHCLSRAKFRGVVGGRGHAVLNGLVKVDAGAVKTDSDLHMAHLLLSDKSQVNAKPELQIDNDDVRCSHGAACGQLDAAALFYLRSRGIDADTARRLLIGAFVHLPALPDRQTPLGARIDECLDAALQRLLQAEAVR